MQITELIRERARETCPRILFPESEEPMILKAAVRAAELKIAKPVLLGEDGAIRSLARQEGIELGQIEVLTPSEKQRQLYAARLAEQKPEMTEKMILRKLRNPLYYASGAVHLGDGESFIAGYRFTTGEVILAASSYIGIREDTGTISSINIVTIPGFQGSEGESLIFTDVAVCIDPRPEQLADIAMLAADGARQLLGWQPRIGFLSYSTKGSGESEMVGKVTKALDIFKQKNPEVWADGEFQLEVALSADASRKKLGYTGPVAGCANIVVFPDLNAGNTNIKAVKLFAKANSIGPILTGFRKPVSDLSRTGSLEHLVSTIAAVAAMCKKEGI